MLDARIFVYRIDTGSGEQDIVSMLDSDWVFQHGLTSQAILGVIRAGADPSALTPDDFQENPAFQRLLADVIRDSVGTSDGIRRAAQAQGTGYVYVIDARTPNPSGQVPPQDIVGAVAVAGGHLEAGSYRHNPRHRLFTADGWFRLPDDLANALRNSLRTTAE